MKKQLSNCQDLSICYCNKHWEPQELMSDWIFITKEVYKENCSKDCINKNVCSVILELLSKGKNDVAGEYLKRYSK